MKLSTEQSHALLEKTGSYITEACDECGKLLAEVRFTRRGEPGEWCSRECRDGIEAAERHRITRRSGRPRKYRNREERRARKTQQQRDYRLRPGVEKTTLHSIGNKGLAGPKLASAAYPIAKPSPTPGTTIPAGQASGEGS